MAWTRTCAAMAVNGLLVLRAGWTGGNSVLVAAAGMVFALAAVVLQLGQVRGVQLATQTSVAARPFFMLLAMSAAVLCALAGASAMFVV
jgi:hypothetical protein